MTLHAAGECDSWMEFAYIRRDGHAVPVNVFRHMKRRGWVEDTNAEKRKRFKYEPGGPLPYEACRPRWRLTKSGREAAKSIAAEEGQE